MENTRRVATGTSISQSPCKLLRCICCQCPIRTKVCGVAWDALVEVIGINNIDVWGPLPNSKKRKKKLAREILNKLAKTNRVSVAADRPCEIIRGDSFSRRSDALISGPSTFHDFLSCKMCTSNKDSHWLLSAHHCVVPTEPLPVNYLSSFYLQEAGFAVVGSMLLKNRHGLGMKQYCFMLTWASYSIALVSVFPSAK